MNTTLSLIVHSQYIFNLKDLSKVFEGLCQCSIDKTTNGKQLARLWRNEVMRIFFDRLVSSDDKDLVSGIMDHFENDVFSVGKSESYNENRIFKVKPD